MTESNRASGNWFEQELSHILGEDAAKIPDTVVMGENDQGESEPDDPYPNGKTEPKPYHCPICGMIYYDKGDAKQCRRSHEWQNRRGRR